MRITQGTFSYLPDLTDEQIAAQVRYALDHGWAISVEFTDDPHPPQRVLGHVGPPDVRPPTGRGPAGHAGDARVPRGPPCSTT